VTLDDPDLFISVAANDWLTDTAGPLLHAPPAAWTAEQRDDMDADWSVQHPVTFACGQQAAGAWIPGLLSRLGAERCPGCCDTLGYPQGTGSPKNNETCRQLLGLEL
jgi:hypothetical protein